MHRTSFLPSEMNFWFFSIELKEIAIVIRREYTLEWKWRISGVFCLNNACIIRWKIDKIVKRKERLYLRKQQFSMDWINRLIDSFVEEKLMGVEVVILVSRIFQIVCACMRACKITIKSCNNLFLTRYVKMYVVLSNF